MQRVVGPNSTGHRVMVAGGPDHGVRFASTADGEMLSEEIPDHIADAFCAVPGYSLWVKPTETKPHRSEPRAVKETT